MASERPTHLYSDELYADFYRCPSCGEDNIVGPDPGGPPDWPREENASFKFCPDCGIRLKWERTDGE